MMRQYLAVKRQHPDELLLFRMGDFYELFFEDAEIASRVLGIALTSREKGPNPVPMAGFPYHALDTQLRRLVQAGYRVAICEQVQDPREAKGLVRREVVRIVTPGTLTEDSLLEPGTHNYLAAVNPREDVVGLAWVDLSTGDFCAEDVPPDELASELGRLEPAECLVPEREGEEWLRRAAGDLELGAVTTRPVWSFHPDQAEEVLRRQFEVSTLEGFGIPPRAAAVGAAGAIVEYLKETQRAQLEHLTGITWVNRIQTMQIDPMTRRNLELMRSLTGKKEGSLLAVLDETVTSMGARLLAEWLSAPLLDMEQINARLDVVEELVGEHLLRRELAGALAGLHDLERLTARLAVRRSNPRELRALAETLDRIPEILDLLERFEAPLLVELRSRIDPSESLRDELLRALVDEPPTHINEGGIIRDGYSEELDELRKLSRGGKQWLAEYERKEIERTGIPSLKIGFHRVFGYYIEVTHTHASRVPPDYQRKQTLKGAERYITPELKEYEQRVLRAEQEAVDLEKRLFDRLRDLAIQHVPQLMKTAKALAAVDVLQGLASVAVRRNYCRPVLVAEPILELYDSRHPVVEASLVGGRFVPNDVVLRHEDARLIIVTGPNMAGKSTYIRQAALGAIMAQIGSFVPARKAIVGLVDRVFARVGASDDLARGRSTFMVEMVETATILHGATHRSLVILDEIGRGTSTYDGVALAWAVAEHLHDVNRCRTLFATHYHELAHLEKSLDAVKNLNVAVREWNDQILFLHRIVEGASDRSYGIHVARLAGVPRRVIERAKTLLAELEEAHLNDEGTPRLVQASQKRRRSSFVQRSLFTTLFDGLAQKLREIDPDSLTPEQAIEVLRALKDEAESL